MTEESQNKVVGSGSMPFDKEYAQWIAELAKRYRSSQIKASIKVNDEMLRFYWSVGEDICHRAADLQGEEYCAGSLCVIRHEPANGNLRV